MTNAPLNRDLLDALLLEAPVERLEKAELLAVFEAAGFSGPLAEQLAASTLAWWERFEEPRRPQDLRLAFDFALESVTWRVPDILLRQAPPAEVRKRAPAPEEVREVELPGHGTVCHGRVGRDGTGTRPHIHVWFKAGEDPDCKAYEWYQFVFLDIYVDRHLRTNDLRSKGRTFKAATGIEATFGQWNPDYQKNRIEEREAARGSEFPVWKPDDPGFRGDNVPGAKPHHTTPTHLPGRPLLLVDAPDLCSRRRNKKGKLTKAQIELTWRQLPERYKKMSVERPPAGSEVVEVRMDFRTYLFCLDDESCVGYLSWEYRNRVTIDYEWELWPRPGESSVDLGMSGGSVRRRRRWRPRNDISACEYSLRVGDWVPC
jgi:hypothetical protein